MKNFRETVQRAIDKHWQTLRFLLSPLSKEALVNSLMNLYSLTYAKDLDKLLGSSSFKKILQDNKIKEIFINNIKTHKGNLWPVIIKLFNAGILNKENFTFLLNNLGNAEYIASLFIEWDEIGELNDAKRKWLQDFCKKKNSSISTILKAIRELKRAQIFDVATSDSLLEKITAISDASDIANVLTELNEAGILDKTFFNLIIASEKTEQHIRALYSGAFELNEVGFLTKETFQILLTTPENAKQIGILLRYLYEIGGADFARSHYQALYEQLRQQKNFEESYEEFKNAFQVFKKEGLLFLLKEEDTLALFSKIVKHGGRGCAEQFIHLYQTSDAVVLKQCQNILKQVLSVSGFLVNDCINLSLDLHHAGIVIDENEYSIFKVDTVEDYYISVCTLLYKTGNMGFFEKKLDEILKENIKIRCTHNYTPELTINFMRFLSVMKQAGHNSFIDREFMGALFVSFLRNWRKEEVLALHAALISELELLVQYPWVSQSDCLFLLKQYKIEHAKSWVKALVLLHQTNNAEFIKITESIIAKSSLYNNRSPTAEPLAKFFIALYEKYSDTNWLSYFKEIQSCFQEHPDRKAFIAAFNLLVSAPCLLSDENLRVLMQMPPLQWEMFYNLIDKVNISPTQSLLDVVSSYRKEDTIFIEKFNLITSKYHFTFWDHPDLGKKLQNLMFHNKADFLSVINGLDHISPATEAGYSPFAASVEEISALLDFPEHAEEIGKILGEKHDVARNWSEYGRVVVSTQELADIIHQVVPKRYHEPKV